MCFPTLSKVSQLILNSPFKELSEGGIGCVFLHHLQPARPLLWAIYHAVSQSSIFRNWAYIISNGRGFFRALFLFGCRTGKYNYFLVFKVVSEQYVLQANCIWVNMKREYWKCVFTPLKKWRKYFFWSLLWKIWSNIKSKTRYSSRKNANISMQYFYTCVKTNSTD